MLHTPVDMALWAVIDIAAHGSRDHSDTVLIPCCSRSFRQLRACAPPNSSHGLEVRAVAPVLDTFERPELPVWGRGLGAREN